MSDRKCSMGNDPTTNGRASGGLDWAVPALLDLTRAGERLLVVGESDDCVVDALRSAGREIRAVPPVAHGVPSPEAILGRAEDADTVVLADVLSWVRDEVRYLQELLASLPDALRLVVVAPNVTWLPHRLSLLAGRSPFGAGPIADRPLRFFARDTLLDALGAAGAATVDLRAVTQEPRSQAEGLPPEIVAEVRTLADADVIGFVAAAGASTYPPEDEDLVDAAPIRAAARGTVGEQVRAEVREQEQQTATRQLAAAAEVAALRARVEELEAERDRLAPAAEELEVVRARLGYRGLVRMESAASKVPFAMAVWRRAARIVRRSR